MTFLVINSHCKKTQYGYKLNLFENKINYTSRLYNNIFEKYKNVLFLFFNICCNGFGIKF